MKNIFFLSALAFVLLFSASCNRYYYKPNAVNAPMFTDGNQFHVAGAGMIRTDEDDINDGNSYFFDVQAAYSPIKHLGIIANYSTWAFRPNTINFASGNVDADAHLAEVGVGGYLVAGQKKAKLVGDLYVGGGGGNLRSDVDMKVRRLFLQPGIGMRHAVVDVGFNLRISNVKYMDLDDNGRGMAYLQDKRLYDINRNRRIDEGSYFFLEPAVTVRTGYKFIKAQFQWGFANEVSTIPWNYNGARFTIGLHFSLEDALQMGKASSVGDN